MASRKYQTLQREVMAKVLLVDLDKDYLYATEQKDERDILKSRDINRVHDMGYNLFDQAMYNLMSDVELWRATSGISLRLKCEKEVEVEIEKLGGQTISRTYTRVYGILDTDDDLAWMTMNLGNLKPSTSLIRTEHRGWQFEWKK